MENIQFVLGAMVPATIGLYLVFQGLGVKRLPSFEGAENLVKIAGSVALVYAGAL